MGSRKQCVVCCEPYTKQLRKPIECPFCHQRACALCQKKYLLSSSIDPRCMHCFHEWKFGFLQTVLPKVFLKQDYAQHRARVLFERERQVLPQSQRLVENFHKANHERNQIPEKRAAIIKLQREIQSLEENIQDHLVKIQRYSANHYEGDASITRTQKRQRHIYIFPCGQVDCRGFLTTHEQHPSKLVCGVCQSTACAQCGDIIETDDQADSTADDRHVCLEDNKRSFAVLKSHSKPCPSCAVPTQKIEGCHQMWCTQCHTAWDWHSGNVLRGTIHNPHYFEYLRQTTDGDIPRQPGDVPCGGHVTGWQVRQALLSYKRTYPNIDQQNFHRWSTFVYQITNAITHMENVSVPRARDDITRLENMNLLRLQYLINQITEDEYKRLLQWREHRIEKQTALIDLMETAVAVCTDNIAQFMEGNVSLQQTVKALFMFKQYQNKQCDKCKNLFGLSFQDAKIKAAFPEQ